MDEWKVSLHGGHSGEYCDHAEGTLRAILDAAVRFGYYTFGVSEHAPRLGEPYLYDKEKELGWTVAKITDDFDRYTLALPALVEEYADRLTILRGFEAEIVPPDRYAQIMRGYREQTLPNGSPAFDYMVGSVHFINGYSIDGPRELFDKAVESCGGIVELMEEYYRQVARMVEALRPEVVGHFDLIELNYFQHWEEAGYDAYALERGSLVAAALTALDAIKAYDCILDLNTAGWRKGLGRPYPRAEWVECAQQKGIPFCFGDDSHRVEQVGDGITRAREYLLKYHINTITALTKEERTVNAPVIRRVVPLG